MRGRAISVLLVLLSTTLPILADCSWVSRYSGQFRATAFDVAADGEGFVWLATGYGVQLFEPASGRYIVTGSAPLPGMTRVVALNGTIAYVGSGSRVYVIRRDGRKLTVIGSVDAGGTVNDILVTSYLFVATSNGIAHFDLFDATHPNRTNIVLITSRQNVTKLALSGSTMYAADGDSSVERFTLSQPSFPQGITPLDSLARSSSVHVANDRLYVSDDLGLDTQVFVGTSKLGSIGYGTNAFAPLTSNSIFAAGPQRIFRALEVTSVTRVAEIYEQQLQPFGGTNNRIFAMARSGNTLFVAAGDMGFVTYDISTLISPHPVISYSEGQRNSVVTIGDKAYFAGVAGIFESAINRNGISLTPQRSWEASTSSTVHDASGTSLLSSTGKDVKIWSVDTATPATTFTATLPDTVRDALLTNDFVIVHLIDYSVWRVPRAGGGAPQAVTVDGPRVLSIARTGNAVAFLQISDDGKTTIRYYANGDVTAAPRVFDLDGAAIGGIALSATTAAVFTFRGLNLIDLASGNIRALPGSTRTLPRQLILSGNNLLVVGDASLSVWDTSTNALLRENPLPATPVEAQVTNGIAVMASSGGSMAADYAVTLPKPSAANGNRFYKKAVAAANYLYLFDDRVDVYFTGKGAAPAFVTNIPAVGTIDIAALPQTLYALGGFGTVTSYSTSGAQLAQITINEGTDAQPLAITTAGNAIWVAFEKGCSTGTCQHKTLVLDPQTLAVTATMTGGVTRVVTSGTRAYALFSTPDEMRVLNIANPLLPSQVMSAASPANANDIAFSAGTIYVMADKVRAYNEAFLPAGEFLDSSTAIANLAIEGDCAVVTGRAESPLLYTTASWSAASSQLQAPSPVRLIAQQPGRLFLLTDHSIEVWTNAPPPSSGKRRAAR